jgi:release factor glutamine methyltransferase
MTGAEALSQAAPILAEAGIADPRRDAARLLAWVTGADRLGLALTLAMALSAQQRRDFEAAIALRATHRPVSRIIGARLFWGRHFAISDAVLDPRPETETLVAAALELPWTEVLDIGVGSGAILLSLLADRPEARGTGTDCSVDAKAVAAGNAARLGLEHRVTLCVADWFPPRRDFDLIVSNPPYIPSADIAALAPEVRDHDPPGALDGGPDGLAAFRQILAGAGARLRAGGHILLEHGPGQEPAIAAIAGLNGLGPVRSLADMEGRARVAKIGPIADPSRF